ncbi:MAG TPA: aldehyde dehydrogenase family protein [Solirubrobacteraceae bacterium]|nr:aldehyde dehydrogenase family protein [Solirubrobacteraceae bacterium]
MSAPVEGSIESVAAAAPLRVAPAAFASEPVRELRRPAVREALQSALTTLEGELPLQVQACASGGGRLWSLNPCRPQQVVAVAPVAGEGDVGAAVGAAVGAGACWAAVPATERAEVLRGAAAWMRERRDRLAALALLECAKPWAEADADVCEAIDFLEYYARAAVALDEPLPLVSPPGEHNSMRYRARGVVAVIAPWNFPFAIATGMSAAGIATGNTVVLKPAEQSPACAGELAHALAAAGLPDGVFTLATGAGETGAALARDARVQTIAFTGSVPVGRQIIAAAAARERRHLTRVVCEMGGKNCVLVDGDADLDEVVPDVIASAYAYAGQKCSAASRVLVHERIHDTLVERLAGAVRLLRVGDAASFETNVPALIDEESVRRVARYAALAREEGEIAAEQDAIPDAGWYAAPSLVTGLPANSPVLEEEIFGPLLAVQAVRDIDAACDIVDALPFALTGGLFSRDPAVVERVIARSPVGNLYVNRGTTGAKVARQPFGGNRLSGSGAKAGGPDYLLQFVDGQVVSENTVRHGVVL